MTNDQILIGGMTAALCAAGLWKSAWLLENTRKGRRLITWCGSEGAAWVLRLALLLGLGFGVLLAIGVVNPVRHAPASSGARPAPGGK